MKRKHPALVRIGQTIRDLRKSKGFSQESFGEVEGQTPQSHYISKHQPSVFHGEILKY